MPKKVNDESIAKARAFAKTPRGQLIFGQALAVASDMLKDTEPSNSDDMKFLGENLFGIWYAIYTPEAQEAIRKTEEEVAKLNQQAQS